jgi:Domain of unknown function (DUF397)
MSNPWRKSRHSESENCIEVAKPERQLAIRDSKDPDGPRLAFADRDWDRFLARVRRA